MSERTTAELVHEIVHGDADEIARLKAENDRLREALSDAIRVLEWDIGSRVVGEPNPKPVLERARKALERTNG